MELGWLNDRRRLGALIERPFSGVHHCTKRVEKRERVENGHAAADTRRVVCVVVDQCVGAAAYLCVAELCGMSKNSSAMWRHPIGSRSRIVACPTA